ncbi:MAG: leucine-rich repeat protein [Muribaculaceae bacterium]|nr:leucine-rich repeat protein [Muribaculaceae bacterium]
MRNFLLSLLTVFSASFVHAIDFEYNGIVYTITDSDTKKCETKAGKTIVEYGIEWYEPGNPVSGDIVIPDTVLFEGEKYSVTTIGKLSFVDCQDLTGVVIPESVTLIDNMAFFYCKNLKFVSIPSKIRIMGSEAFEDCTSLASISVSSLEDWCRIYFRDYLGNPLYNGGKLMVNGMELTDLVVPESVTTIQNNSFAGYESLRTVYLHDDVQSIGDNAFYNCANLEQVRIGTGLLSSSPYAFYGCNALEAVHISDLSAWCDILFSSASSNPLGFARHLFLDGEEISDIVLPEGLGHVADYAFYKCLSLTNVEFPESMTWMGEMAFYGCENLQKVNLPSNLSTVGTWTFALCSSLAEVTIPSVITKIPAYAFYSCESLHSVNLPSTLYSIDNAAFAFCSSLSDIALPASLNNMGSNAFYNTGITNVVVPSGSIGTSAFADSPVETVTLGWSVNQVGNYAFDNGFAPAEIFVAAETPPTLFPETFSGFSSDLYVLESSMSRYAQGNWGKFTDVFALVEPDSVVIESQQPETTLTKGSCFTLSAKVYPENVSIPYVTWSSSNNEVATVDNLGNVTLLVSESSEPCEIVASTLYANGPIASYVIDLSEDGVDKVIVDLTATEYPSDIYNLQGICIKRNASAHDVDNLAPGLYIIAGKKHLIP